MAPKSAPPALDAGHCAVVAHPPPTQRLPPDNRVGLYDVRSGARSYDHSIDMEKDGHAQATTLTVIPPPIRPWRTARARDCAQQDQFFKIIDSKGIISVKIPIEDGDHTQIAQSEHLVHLVHLRDQSPEVLFFFSEMSHETSDN